MFAGGGGLAEFSSFMPFLVCRLNEWKFAWVFEQMGVEDCIKLATDCCCRLFCLFLWQVERGVSPLSHAYLYRLEKARVWGLTYSLSVEKKSCIQNKIFCQNIRSFHFVNRLVRCATFRVMNMQNVRV